MPKAGSGVLITRPEPGASDTAARVTTLGFRPVIAPLLQIMPRRPALPPSDRIQAILATSGNAIQALPDSHRHLPLLAVGEATAARARAAGFTDVRSADGDARALTSLTARYCDPHAGTLLLACGRGQGSTLAAALRDRGYGVVRRVVYAACPVASLPPVLRDALLAGDVTAAMFFSAATARAGVHVLDSARLHEAVRPIDALAIGQPTAMALERLPWRRIRVADRPNQDAMLALLR